MKTPVEAVGETNVGMKRSHNEDTYYLLEDEYLFVLCDGMGGHASGEVASHMTVETLKTFFKETREDPEMTWPYKMDRTRRYQENRLVASIKLANLRIYEAAKREAKYAGMGTTLVTSFFVEDGVYLTHVGDSRIYRIRNKKIEQITEDHSLLNDYIKMKKLTPEEIKNFPHKNVIVRALGMKESVKVDTFFEVPQQRDTYLLCSDGLSGEISDEKMLEICLDNSKNLQGACHELIEAANRAGGHDNITVVLVRTI